MRKLVLPLVVFCSLLFTMLSCSTGLEQNPQDHGNVSFYLDSQILSRAVGAKANSNGKDLEIVFNKFEIEVELTASNGKSYKTEKKYTRASDQKVIKIHMPLEITLHEIPYEVSYCASINIYIDDIFYPLAHGVSDEKILRYNDKSLSVVIKDSEEVDFAAAGRNVDKIDSDVEYCLVAFTNNNYEIRYRKNGKDSGSEEVIVSKGIWNAKEEDDDDYIEYIETHYLKEGQLIEIPEGQRHQGKGLSLREPEFSVQIGSGINILFVNSQYGVGFDDYHGGEEEAALSAYGYVAREDNQNVPEQFINCNFSLTAIEGDEYNQYWIYYTSMMSQSDFPDENTTPPVPHLFARGTWKFLDETHMYITEQEYLDIDKNEYVQNSASSASFQVVIDENNTFTYISQAGFSIQFIISNQDPNQTQMQLDGELRYSLNSSGEYTYSGNQTSTVTAYTNKYALDSEGNAWIFKEVNTSASIVTNKSGYSNIAYYVDCIEINGGYGIMIDQKSDILYTYFKSAPENQWSLSDDNTKKATVYKYSNFISNPVDNPQKTTYAIEYSNDFLNELFNSADSSYTTFRHLTMTVYNSKLYDLIISDNDMQLYLIQSDLGEEMLENSSSLVSGGFKPESCESVSNKDCFDITDMIFQDDYLYILYKNTAIEADNSGFAKVFQHGGLIRINTKEGTNSDSTNILGWSGASDVVSVDCTQGPDKFVVYTSNKKPAYTDETLKEYLTLSGNQISGSEDGIVYKSSRFPSEAYTFRVPVYYENPSATTYNFYSPQKFLAIKPKKLVISDSGIAFYTTTDGIWAYKNINRIVTVDLENFLISSVTDATGDFTQRRIEPVVFCGSGMTAELSDGQNINGYYNTDGTSYVQIASDFTRYLGIPNID